MSGLRVSGLRTEQIGPINLSLDASETIFLTGASGSGKTLLLRAVADLDPHQGQVYLGHRLQEQLGGPEWRRQVMYLPTESGWWAESVGEHFPAGAFAWLVPLGFTLDCLRWEISRLSSGERQRLALARLLSRNPIFLLLDEPTANLDPANARRVEQAIGDYQQKTGAGVLWVSHDRRQRRRLGARSYRLQDGRLEKEAPPWT
jgi:ABC-type iron transport system FetAB ATPase subunit